jgi:hypothetical protein
MTSFRTRVIVARASALITLLGALAMAVFALVALEEDPLWVEDIPFLILLSTFGVVGGLVASRRPENSIGWLCLAIGVLFALLGTQDNLVQWAVEQDMLDTAGWIAIGGALWVPAVGLLGTHLPLRLPDGQLLSKRWAAYSRFCTAVIVLSWVLASVDPAVLDHPGVENPLAVGWADVLGPLYALLPLSCVGAIASLFIRYRRSSGVRRLQLRWLAFGGGVVFVAAFPFGYLLGWLGVDADVAAPFFLLALSAIPATIGVAVLRHRLYEIDTIVNRTLVYTALTATLAATYVVTVLLLQLALGGLTSGSGLAVAVSTLAVAAAFRPARARIQHAVDRRFFRRRYDARRTLEGFSARVRDEVELAALDAELRAVVAETMQPAHVSLWLRPAGRPADARRQGVPSKGSTATD